MVTGVYMDKGPKWRGTNREGRGEEGMILQPKFGILENTSTHVSIQCRYLIGGREGSVV